MSAYIGMLICMRTTLNINDDLVRLAKQRAAAEDRTVTSLIEEALHRLLSAGPSPEPHRLRLLPSSELQPGLDPNDPAFYKQVLERDDFERYGPHTRLRGSRD